VKHLVAGPDMTFADSGSHRLEGIPDRWLLFAVGEGYGG
jgi:hypothetical protein